MDDGASTGEASRLLNVSVQAVQKMIKSGVLEAQLVAIDDSRKRWVIDRGALDALVAERASRSVVLPDAAVNDVTSMAREAFAGLRSAERTIEELRIELASLERERYHQTATALEALDRVDQLQREVDRLRTAHAALLSAHAALLGIPAQQ